MLLNTFFCLAWTRPGVHLECTGQPGTPVHLTWSLPGVYLECLVVTWILPGLYQDRWGSVKYWQQQAGPSNQGQRGPKWPKNRANRENKCLAQAIKSGKAPENAFELANIPKYANMAIIGGSPSIKQEDIEMDLSEPIPPITARSKSPSPLMIH